MLSYYIYYMAYGYGGTRQSEPKMKSPQAKAKSSPKPKSSGMTDKQKADLKKHMAQHKDLKDLSASQRKSHRAKMASRLRKGMSMAQAHRDIVK
jgi:hypothetical protein